MSQFTKTKIVDGDGGGDYTTIKEAADYFINNTIGGVIIVESGSYAINGTLNKTRIDIPSNVTIIGRGNVVLNVTVDTPVFRNINYLQSSGNQRITISGFKIVVSISQDTYTSNLIDLRNVSNCVLEKLTISASPTEILDKTRSNNAIYFSGADSTHTSSGNIISQCKISDYRTAIQFNGYCTDNVIKNNYVSNCFSNCYIYNSNNNIITGNIFTKSSKGSGTNNQGCDGVLADLSNNLVITGNQMIENAEHGIYLSGCEGCTIRGNILKKNYNQGIQFRLAGTSTSTQFSAIVGNICLENGQDAVNKGNGIGLMEYSYYNGVYGNVCYSNLANGIRVGTPTENAAYNALVGNVCAYNSDEPIDIDSAGNIERQNIKV